MGPLCVELTEWNWVREWGYVVVLVVTVVEFDFRFFAHVLYIIRFCENCQLGKYDNLGLALSQK